MSGCHHSHAVLIVSSILIVFTTAHAHDWRAPAKAAARKNPMAVDDASIARGKALYRMRCADCHGEAGRGDGPKASRTWPRPPDLNLMAGNHPDGDVAWKIENGRGDMPGFKEKLKPEEIWDTVNFIQRLNP